MTTPGSLPPRRSVYTAPTVAPEEMSPEQQEQFSLAQVAGIVAASAAAKQSVANQVTLMLVPLMRGLDPYNPERVAEFAYKAAQLVTMGRNEVSRIAWSSVVSQAAAYDVVIAGDTGLAKGGRTTKLEYAYRRVAADYRRRMAAGTESIKGLIAQMEEERFQALGGAVVAEGRTGESNAKIEGTKRSPTSVESKKKPAGSGASGKSQGGSVSTGAATGEPKPKPLPKDRPVNEQSDDWDELDAADAAARKAQDDADDAAFEAEQELRRQAALNDEERQRVLEQAAQHEMEMRAERMIADDLAMASRQASIDAMQKAPAGKITGYRRVLHPELSETGACGLCVAASDRKYSVRELMPIHNLCKCEVVPIFGGKDPGSQINDEDLATLYEQAGNSTAKQDLINVKYEVFQHPELGPVLRVKGQNKKVIKFSEREPSSAHVKKVGSNA